eukprot:364495-Chlamydomonas_euryale.AAC.17
MELDEAAGQLLPGPWSMRDVHPTTTLLLAVPQPAAGSGADGWDGGGAGAPPGVLAISSRGVTLITCPAPPAVAQLAAAV